jgi:hypothetical protein
MQDDGSFKFNLYTSSVGNRPSDDECRCDIMILVSPEDVASAEGSRIHGTIGNRNDVIVGVVPQDFVFDIPFVNTEVDSLGNTVPKYRFIIESAFVPGSDIAETVNMSNKTLTGITLVSSSPNTLVRFIAEERL